MPDEAQTNVTFWRSFLVASKWRGDFYFSFFCYQNSLLEVTAPVLVIIYISELLNWSTKKVSYTHM